MKAKLLSYLRKEDTTMMYKKDGITLRQKKVNESYTSTFFHSSYKGYIQHITLKMLQLLNMKAERRTYIIITYEAIQ